MIRNYFKIAWRNLRKHKFYTLINIFGLSLGIGCSIILFQFITYHLSFDTYHHDAKQLYKVVTELHLDDGSVLFEQGSPLAMLKAKVNIPQIKEATAVLRIHNTTISVTQQGNVTSQLFAEHENVAITDNHFFDLFDYEWEQGNKNNALSEPNTMVLSHTLAQKYFNSQDVIGKTIRIDNKNNFKITGVIKDHPANTDIKTDMFLSLSTLKSIYPDVAEPLQTDWGWINTTTAVYFLLPDHISPQSVETMIRKMTVRDLGHRVNAFHFKLQPLSEVHFDGRYSGIIQRSLLVTLGLIGLLLIVIACVNFINMATAQSFKRAKEIGTRKVLGSTPSAIFFQFMAETASITFFAALLSVLWVWITLPVINNWLQTSLTLNFISDLRLIFFVLILLVLIIITAGFYPAMLLSRFKPVNALKNQLGQNTKSAGLARKSLIVVQNVIAQVLIISTILITLQVRYLKTADLGFNKSAVLMLPVPDNTKSKTDFLRNHLLTYPGITDVSFCYRAPASTADKGGSIKYDSRPWEKFVGRTIMGDAGYVKTFGLRLIAGRNLAEGDTAKEYLVNEKLIQKLGVKDPQQVIGHRLAAGDLSDNPGTIVGVVKDFNSKSLYTAVEPEYITTFRSAYQNIGVKISSNDPSTILAHIKKEWQAVYPDHVFEYRFLDEQIADFYKKEDLLNKLIKSSAVIAIFISCLGLLGLISILTLQRTKEIGIRKVLGASVTHVTTLLSVDFLKLVFIAVVIASPVAWLMMSKYLQNFAYRIEIQWWVFAVTAALTILIAFITVSFQSIKAAMANPINSLRDE
ncbi:ABC transporter permease [Mucilaginibacter sp. RCC_168]|uniref:ABC transporter permease n=1 Tax=Mucilaginibacter sp. RCC_168 TaxID=3239221 RepID=UPI003526020F